MASIAAGRIASRLLSTRLGSSFATSAAARAAAGSEPADAAVAKPFASGLHRARPAGAFRLNPNNRAEWLIESDVASAAENCRLLLAAPNPPRPVALQRVLTFVHTKEDLALAIKCFNLCRAKGVKFDMQTSAAFVAACLRAGDVPAALARLRDSASTRLFLSEASLRLLLAECARQRDPALLTATIATAWHFGYHLKRVNMNTSIDMVTAYAACGDLKAALRGYEKLAATCGRRAADGVPLLHLRHEPVAAILAAVLAAPAAAATPVASASKATKGGTPVTKADKAGAAPTAAAREEAHPAWAARLLLPVAKLLAAAGSPGSEVLADLIAKVRFTPRVVVVLLGPAAGRSFLPNQPPNARASTSREPPASCSSRVPTHLLRHLPRHRLQLQ